MFRDFKFNISSFSLCLMTLLIGCQTQNTSEEISKIQTVLSEVQAQYAPDSRVAIFDIAPEVQNDTIVLKGRTNLPQALQAFKAKLQDFKHPYIDSIASLPSSALAGKTQGIIALSAANLRGKPKHSAELVTQGTLGMPVTIYQKKGSWYLIQTPDQYIAWVDAGGITPMDSLEFKNWKQSDKLIYTQTYGSAYAQKDASGQIVSDLVAGNIVKLLGKQGQFYHIEYPDQRTAFVPTSQAIPYKDWLSSLSQSKQSLVDTSKRLMGVPYLWGGTSPKGVDCSGFTKTIFFLNGLIIPRDASQQIHQGLMVDRDKDFSKLQPGDLLFFGKKATDSTKERIVHVGMWIGNNEFIHSAGRVHISSVEESSPNYDPYNLGRYIRTKRLLNQKTDGIIDLQNSSLFKK